MSEEVVNKIKEQILISRENESFICELKITEACNLACSYCYRHEQTPMEKVISVDIAISFFDQFFRVKNQFVVCCFHGGEPLLHYEVIKEFLEKISTKPYYKKMKFTLQTNGTVCNDEIISIIKKYKINIGVSLDGIGDIHDIQRKYRNNSGSYGCIYNNIIRLKKEGIRLSATCVVTKDNVKHLLALYKFCRDNEFVLLGFNMLRQSEEKNRINNLIPDVDEYSGEMIKIIDCLIKDSNEGRKKVSVREIGVLAQELINPERCNYVCQYPCGAGTRLLCLNTDGRVDMCDCIGQNEFNTLGFLTDENLKELLKSNKIEKFLFDRKEIFNCRECDIEKYCRYGCVAERYIYYGNVEKKNTSNLCEWRKKVMHYLQNKMSEGIKPDVFI